MAKPRSGVAETAEHRMLNAITRRLSIQRWEALEPHAHRVSLRAGETLSVCYQPPRFIYFPTTAVCIVTATNDDTNEARDATLIGNEGFVGLWTLLHNAHESMESTVKLSGDALRFRPSIVQQEFEISSAFRLSILRYLSSSLRVASGTLHCSRHHSIEQQVSKILLLTQNRVEIAEIRLTHQDIATLLGVRREAVSIAAHDLVNAGVLKQQRGVIRIIDTKGLRERACDCTEMIFNEFYGEG